MILLKEIFSCEWYSPSIRNKMSLQEIGDPRTTTLVFKEKEGGKRREVKSF